MTSPLARQEPRPTNFRRLTRFWRAAVVVAILTHSLVLPPFAVADDVITSVMSPIASYQFPEDFNTQALTNGGISSPIASYVYFEWPEDDILRRLDSPVVSYFYQWGLGGAPVILEGRVLDTSGTPVAGAKVAVSVLESPLYEMVTDTPGEFAFPPLDPGIYTLGVTAPGKVPSRRVLSLSAQTAWQTFVLSSAPPPVTLQPATGNLADTLIPQSVPVTSDQLRVWQNGQFVSNGSVYRNRMTVVLTHGWRGSSTDWPAALAQAIPATVRNQVNLLAWDWTGSAKAILPPESETPNQGFGLGIALWNSLGGDYSQEIHFIGHSLGTLVNACAADYLHGTPRGRLNGPARAWDSNRTHLTLFDEAEVARILDKDVLFGLVKGYVTKNLAGTMVAAVDALAGWKSPVPKNSGWVDNYISSIGIYHADAVNVVLQKGIAFYGGNVFAAHSYPQEWYRISLARPGDSALGFIRSFESEYAGIPGRPAFPPGNTIPLGEAYRQVDASTDPLALELLPLHRFYETLVPAVTVSFEYVVEAPAALGRYLGESWAEHHPEAAVTLDRSMDRIEAWVANGVDAVQDSVVLPGVRLILKTKQKLLGDGRVVLHGDDGNPINEPAYVWLPVAVPSDAAAMAFDFRVAGDPVEDFIAFGINETNRFAIQGKFLPEDELASSTLINVTSYAGQTNEFFFGITGGTSTNCTVTIQGIRFYTLASPVLGIAVESNSTLLSWPTMAFGYALESSTNVASPVWQTVTNAPTVWDRSYVVTNVWADETRFFRLRQE